jgi:hypothetical protein
MAMNTSSTKLEQFLRMICMPLTVVLVLICPAESVQSRENESEKEIVFLGADKRLQKDAKQFVMMYESVFGADCRKPKVTERQITEQPERPGESVWVERWTVDRCGEDFYYRITFTPTPSKGGTDISVAPPESGGN